MSKFDLRPRPRISYCEYEEPNLDEYIFCEKCGDYVYEYCSIHGPLLVVPDDKVPAKTNYPSFVPRAALTIPKVFLHIAPSTIPGAGLGVFSTLTLPRGVRFGPYRGKRTDKIDSMFCWQLHDGNNKWSHVIDAQDPNASNWMRYVNCARHWCEQNLVAYQYQGQIYYRTIKIIPRYTELMVFYGSEFARLLNVNLKLYNRPTSYAQHFGAVLPKKLKLNNEIITNGEPKMHTAEIENDSGKKLNVRKDEAMKTANVKKNKKKFKAPIKIILNENTTSNINCDKNNEIDKSHNVVYTNNNLVCDLCKRAFMCKILLENHLRESHSIEFNLPTKHTKVLGTDKIEIKEIVNNRKLLINNLCKDKEKTTFCSAFEKPYKCSYCTKSFNLSSNLAVHVMTHTGEKPYKCSYCTKSFNQNGSLAIHVRTHTGEKPYKCNYCTKTFIDSSNLAVHVRTHTGEKPYKCSYCTKSFNGSNDLAKHVRTHTGEKPFKCSYCTKTFINSSNLAIHVRTHTGEKPYKCNYCTKSFIDSSNLAVHVRTHTGEKPYKCSYCTKTFNHSSTLAIHVRTHTGEKPYKCSYCTKSFNQSCYLAVHLRTHTGEKPYKCQLCTKCFTSSRALNYHVKSHTVEKY